MAFQRFLCVAERSTMTQSLQRQRYHTDIERRGIIISNFLEWKKRPAEEIYGAFVGYA